MKTLFKVAAGSALAAAAGICAADNFRKPAVNEYTVYSEKLPEEFDGFRITHISDFHCACIPDLSLMIMEIGADIIVSTGDMVNKHGSVERALNLTRKLAFAAPFYMVHGNHDKERIEHRQIENICNSGKGRFLNNESVVIERGGKAVHLSGIDDPYAGACDESTKRIVNDNLDKIENRGVFHILMFHRANLADIPAERGFDLMLAGHMHGGQIRLPKIGGVLPPRRNISDGFFPKYTGGKYQIGKSTLIVSRGLGNPTPLPRINNRPEIVVITLKHR